MLAAGVFRLGWFLRFGGLLCPGRVFGSWSLRVGWVFRIWGFRLGRVFFCPRRVFLSVATTHQSQRNHCSSKEY